MSKYAICDECGERDDWTGDKGPILDGGVVLQFRAESMGDDISWEAELCPACRKRLLESFPKLAEALTERSK